MPTDRTLMAAGTVGAVIAAICCATPLLVVLFGVFGLAAWISKADYVLIPALLLCLALVGFGLYRRRSVAQACCDPAVPNKARSHE